MTAPDVTDSDDFSSKAALMRAFRTRRAFASLGAAYDASEATPSNPNLGATLPGVAARRYGRRPVLPGALSVAALPAADRDGGREGLWGDVGSFLVGRRTF